MQPQVDFIQKAFQFFKNLLKEAAKFSQKASSFVTRPAVHKQEALYLTEILIRHLIFPYCCETAKLISLFLCSRNYMRCNFWFRRRCSGFQRHIIPATTSKYIPVASVNMRGKNWIIRQKIVNTTHCFSVWKLKESSLTQTLSYK